MNTWRTIRPPDATEHLICEKRASSDSSGMLCLALAHNEVHILPQFLNHHRSIGVKHFVIVDDHSTDSTGKFLTKQNDVTVYKPVSGSSYKKDKVAWRCDLLDQIADQCWVLLPDIDEHFVYPFMDVCNVDSLIEQIESEGAQALFTVMVDMYADKPLKDHIFKGENLIEAFPIFDCPSNPARGYRLLPPARRFLKRYPTPPICAYGGVRDRLFFCDNQSSTFLSTWLLQKFAHFGRPLTPGFYQKIANSITRKLSIKRFGSNPFSMTKIGLVKWEKGMRLPGGPHALSRKLKLSSATGAFLHFTFTNGIDGIKYVVQRGQHAGGSVIYEKILEKIDLFELSPFCDISRRFTGPDSLIDCGLIRVGKLNKH